MATTSPDNIWTPDSGDDYALTVDLAAMADTVQDALNNIHSDIDGVQTAIQDSGWVSITPAPGYTANTAIAVRRIGPQVFFKGDIGRDDGNLPVSSSAEPLFTLPDERFRIVTYARMFVGAWGSPNANMTVLIASPSTNTISGFGVGTSFNGVYLGGVTYLAE